MPLTYSDCTVTVTVGGKDFSGTYKQLDKSSITTDDILALLQDEKKAKQLISDWNYGQDLRAKSEVRNSILAKPEVAAANAVDKNVKMFMQMRQQAGKPVTEEQARKVVEAMKDAEVS